MLDGLNGIDWTSLRHAYGPASDVPDLLRALTSPSRRTRTRALYDLHSTIWHQGTVYEATAYAVPFLLELLREPAVPDKAEILGLLQVIAQGRSYVDVHENPERPRQEQEAAAYRDQLQQELTWVRQARAAVSAGVPVYRELLASSSLKMRLASAQALAECTDHFREAVIALRGRLRREPHPVARAGLVWSWFSLWREARRRQLPGAPSEAWMRRSLRRVLRSRQERTVARLVAGLGLAALLPEGEYPGLARFFAAALARCSRALARLPRVGDPPTYFVAHALDRQPRLVLSLFASIAQSPGHPCQDGAVPALEQIIFARPRCRPEAARLLGRLLASANVAVRRHAARLLSQIGRSGELARDALVRALKDTDDETALSAALALSKRGDARAVPFLRERLAGWDGWINLVLQAIARLGPAARETIPRLRTVLRVGPEQTRILAAHALAAMGEASGDAVPEVAALLSDRSVGMGAGWALMQWGPAARAAIPPIVEYLRGDRGDGLARVNAVQALGRMGPHARPAVDVLEQLLHDPSEDVRVAAAVALWHVVPQSARTIPVLIDVLREAMEGNGTGRGRLLALEALEVIGPAGREAAPRVRALLDHACAWTRVQAARVLARMGEPVEVILPVLLAELRCRPVGQLAVECLAEIGPPAAAVPRLRAFLDAEGSISEGGISSALVEEEERFLTGVSAALHAITGEGAEGSAR